MAQPRPAPRRTNDPAGVRNRILDAAAMLFQLKGYQGTAMSDVTAAASVTSGAMFHHFRSKKDLALAVIRERVARSVEETWIEPVTGASSARTGVRKVMADIAAGLDPRAGVKGCPLNNLALELSLIDDEFRQAMAGIFADWQSALATRIEADLAPSRDRAKRAHDLAGFVISTYSGAMALAKAQQDPEPLRACAGQLDRLLAGIAG